MANRRPNYANRIDAEQKAEVTYEIATPVGGGDAKIHLLPRDEDEVEVIVTDFPTPSNLDTDRNYPDLLEEEKKMRTHVAAEWIVSDCLQQLSSYDVQTSDYKSNNPNCHLRDVYFRCNKAELDKAVLAAKQFILCLQEKIRLHAQEYDEADCRTPSDDLA